MIVGLDCDDHVKFFSRIIEPLDCRQQLVDHLRLAMERGDDTVDGQFFIERGEARGLGLSSRRRHPSARQPRSGMLLAERQAWKARSCSGVVQHGSKSEHTSRSGIGIGKLVQRRCRKLWPCRLELLAGARSGGDQHAIDAPHGERRHGGLQIPVPSTAAEEPVPSPQICNERATATRPTPIPIRHPTYALFWGRYRYYN